MNPDQLKLEIERYLADQIPSEPRSLYDPVRAALAYGGKRARPLLTAICSGGLAKNTNWLPAAAAVELLHTFTLVHDDIMDNATIRRGKPAVHVAYGLNAAILSGDVIVALSTKCLAKVEVLETMLAEFSLGFQGVCEGQALDKEFETRNDITMGDYLRMIELKTSRVFELAAVLGAIAGGGDYREPLRQFARQIGLAFQLQDDLLDLIGTADFGKTIGGDILEGKRTALFVLAMDQYQDCDSEDKTLLDRLRDRQSSIDDITSIRELFRRQGILAAVAGMVSTHTEAAIGNLSTVEDPNMRHQLIEYSRQLLGLARSNQALTPEGQ